MNKRRLEAALAWQGWICLSCEELLDPPGGAEEKICPLCGSHLITTTELVLAASDFVKEMDDDE